MSLALAPAQVAAQQFVSAVASASCPGTNQTGAVHVSLQAAIDAALVADDPVIEICPGTYRGPITVNGLGALERLDIRGVGADDDATLVRLSPLPGVPGPIILVDSASAITIRGVTFDGLSEMVPDTLGQVIAIQYDGGPSLTIENVILQNIRDTSGAASGIGVLAGGPTAPGAPVEEQLLQLDRVTINNVAGVGVLADGPGVSLTVDRTLVIGPVQPLVFPPTGVRVFRGARGTVMNSHFSNFRSPAPNRGSGAAIVFQCPAVNEDDFVIAQHNSVRDADLGVSLIDADGGRVVDNTIIDAQIGVSVQSTGNRFFCSASTVPPQNLQIVDNLILDPAQAGVALTTIDPNGSVPISNTISGNSIYADVNLAMMPIMVTAGENNDFSQSVIFGGPTSMILDTTTGNGTDGTANSYTNNRCFGIASSELCVN
jgi:hypothetical protein